MSIQDIVEIITNSGVPLNEAKIEVKLMIEHYCNYTALDVVKGIPLDYDKLKIVEEKAKYRAETHMPVQYIMESAYFYSDKYYINKNVLIPRSETELLVSRVIDIIKSNNFTTVLDIGTGSGCISCAIAKNTNSDVVGIDISEAALDVARINVKNFNLEKKVKLLKSDLFNNIDNKKFDIIVSNPPYIPKGTELQIEVTHEPSIALFTDDKLGVDFYKKICFNASKYLNKDGFIIFEVGYNQSEFVYKLLEMNNYKNIIIEKDLEGIDRIIYAQLV